MVYTKRELDADKLKSLGALVNTGGNICVKSRAETAIKNHYYNDEFSILTYKDPLSHIWTTEVHKEENSGITRTVAKCRRKFCIIRARRLAAFVKNHCYTCRKNAKSALQKIAPFTPEPHKDCSFISHYFDGFVWTNNHQRHSGKANTQESLGG